MLLSYTVDDFETQNVKVLQGFKTCSSPIKWKWLLIKMRQHVFEYRSIYLMSKPQVLWSTKIPLFQKSKYVFEIICTV